MSNLSGGFLKKLNYVGVSALIIYPAILLILACLYINQYSFGLFEFLLIIAGYYVSNISVGLGLHRLWSHDSYKVNKYIELILAIFAAGTLQGPALSWASNHFKHHQHTDLEQDPHTPLKYKNKLMGFLWSHMGWMLVGEGSYKSINRVTMVKLGRNKILRWQLKYYWYIAIIMNSLVPALVGLAIGKTMITAYAGFLFIGVGRLLQQQATFLVNSLCHFIGSRKYINGTARDIWWLAIFLLGENWHNFHHAFPSDYRNGARWYHLDVHKWLIFMLSKCGLAYDLKRTARIRVKSKINHTIEQTYKLRQNQIKLLQESVTNLAITCQKKLTEFEESSDRVKKYFWQSLAVAQYKINKLKLQLHYQIKHCETPSDKIIKKMEKRLAKIEANIKLIILQGAEASS